jgi:hypothetical protein
VGKLVKEALPDFGLGGIVPVGHTRVYNVDPAIIKDLVNATAEMLSDEVDLHVLLEDVAPKRPSGRMNGVFLYVDVPAVAAPVGKTSVSMPIATKVKVTELPGGNGSAVLAMHEGCKWLSQLFGLLFKRDFYDHFLDNHLQGFSNPGGGHRRLPRASASPPSPCTPCGGLCREARQWCISTTRRPLCTLC